MSRQQRTSFEQPVFIIDTEATDVEASTINNFYGILLDNPEAARNAVQQLAGQTALEQTVSKPGGDSADDLRGKVRDYFDRKLERRVEFDVATEEALTNDKEYKRLLSELQKARNLPKASGKAINAQLSWQRREDNIEKHRRNLSHHYLLFFIDRIIDWQANQSTPAQDMPRQFPKAG
jgi:hypothetical protein